jgi:hypothetical protein
MFVLVVRGVTVREYLNRQRLFRKRDGQAEIAVTFGLGSTLYPLGRPRIEKKSSLAPFDALRYYACPDRIKQ